MIDFRFQNTNPSAPWNNVSDEGDWIMALLLAPWEQAGHTFAAAAPWQIPGAGPKAYAEYVAANQIDTDGKFPWGNDTIQG